LRNARESVVANEFEDGEEKLTRDSGACPLLFEAGTVVLTSQKSVAWQQQQQQQQQQQRQQGRTDLWRSRTTQLAV
jgi:hypothetical protein